MAGLHLATLRPRSDANMLRRGYPSESDAVVNKQRIVLTAGISDAVARVERTRFRYRKGKTRRYVAETVLAAEPIHHEAYPSGEWLLITCDSAALSAISVGASNESISTTREARSIVAFPLLTDDAVQQTERVHSGTMSDRRVKNSPRCRRDACLFVAVELILDVRLQLDRLVRQQRLRESHIRPDLNMFSHPENNPRNIGLKTAVLISLEVTNEIELHVSLLLRYDISRWNIEEG